MTTKVEEIGAMGIRRITSDQRLAPILGVGIALIAGATLVAYAVVGRQVGSSLRDSRSVERATQRVTVAASRDPQPIVLPAPEVKTPAQKPQPVTTETVELVAQAPSSDESAIEPETFSGGISGEVNPGLTDRIVGSISEFVARGKIGPSEGPDAPWGATPPAGSPDGPDSYTGGIEGDGTGNESEGHEPPPAEDAEGQEWDWNEPDGNTGNGSDPSDDTSDGSNGGGADVPQDQGGSEAPDDDGQPSDQDSEEGKDDDYDWSDGDEDDDQNSDDQDDGNDDDSDDSGSSSGSG